MKIPPLINRYLLIIVFLFSSGIIHSQCNELFISEYIEGSGNNKYLEIYNPTNAAITLTGVYDVQIFSNGSTAGTTIALNGSIAAFDVFILENSSEGLGVTEDQQSGSLSFNGNDAVALRNTGAIIDVIGQIGFDPGSEWSGATCGTANETLVRNSAIQVGDSDGTNAFDPNVEWTCLGIDDISDLGFHTSSCVSTNEIQLQQPTGIDVACGYSYDFGSQNIGVNSDVTIRIRNTGTADLDITNLSLLNGTSFAIVSAAGTSFTIAGGGYRDFIIRFNPDSLGLFTDTLTITNTDSNEGSCTINIQGIGDTTCGTTTTVIAAQDFESVASDTWNYTANHAPIANYWYVTNSLSSIPSAQSSSNFWGITDLDRAGHNGQSHEIIFDVFDVSAYSNVEFSFYYYTIDVDSSDDLDYELFYDGVSQGIVDISSNTSAWTGVVYNVPDTVNQVQIIFYADLDAGNDQAGLDNFVLSTTTINTTTWDGTTWNPVTPNGTYAAVIAGDYSTSNVGAGNFEACSLTVNAGVTLNIQNTNYVSILNDVNIEGTITVASEASLIQVNDASNVTLGASGDGILQKTTTYLDARYDYTYWSSAFTNETIGSVLMGVPVNRIFKYDAANFEDADNNGFDDNANDWEIAGQAEVMIPGKGYAAMTDQFGMIPGNQTFTFNGQFNNGVITPAVTISPGLNPKNWNFLGNPYPSGIDADLFLGDPTNSGLGGTIYLWTHNSPPDEANPGNEAINFNTDDYASYNSMGGTAAVSGGSAPTRIIASGQGFFIEASANGVATFNNAMRVNLGNTDFFRLSTRIWLDFKNEFGAFSQILIGFDKNASNGVDRLYDGKRLDANNFVSFFSLIEDEKYAIQGRAPITEEEIIPLGVMSTIEGENEFTIGISNIEGVLNHSEVYLVDNLLGVEHDLNEGDYKFTITNTEVKDRFELNLKTDAKFINEYLKDELIILSNKESHELELLTTQQSIISNIKIFDMMGRLLHNADIAKETTVANIRTGDLKNSIFIVNATLENGKVLTKKGLSH